MPKRPHDREVADRDAGPARHGDRRGASLVQLGLGGGYVLFAVAQWTELHELAGADAAALHRPLEASIAASVLFAVGLVLFVRALPFRRTAGVAAEAFGWLGAASAVLAAGLVVVAAGQAGASPRVVVVIAVLDIAGYTAIAAGWWVWYRAAAGPARRRPKARSHRRWPTTRRVTQVALTSGYALFALATLVTIATHNHQRSAVALGSLVHAAGFGMAAIGNWRLVAVLPWIPTAQAARAGLVLLGIGGCIGAVAPYLARITPPAATSIQAVAYLAVAVGWLVWAAAGRVGEPTP